MSTQLCTRARFSNTSISSRRNTMLGSTMDNCCRSAQGKQASKRAGPLPPLFDFSRRTPNLLRGRWANFGAQLRKPRYLSATS
jgi:hypothetical protein